MTMRPYEPVNCEFHDVLESLATTRQRADVVYQDSTGAQCTRSTELVDVFARSGAEYVTLASGETVRLDALISVNGAKPTDF